MTDPVLSVRAQLIAAVLREHAVWTGNDEAYTCQGCGWKTLNGWDDTIEHRADMIDKALPWTQEIADNGHSPTCRSWDARPCNCEKETK